MAALKTRLPPMTGLTVFEAAARLASFTKAAAELGVTQAAVSRQIHLLEGSLGFPLFHRLHRRIELTEKGLLLSSSTTNALNAIAETISSLTRDSDEELAISATVSFSQFWLLPKVSGFSRQYPEVRMRIISQDKTPGMEGDVDIAIRYGNGMWPDGKADFLFDDEIFPVCSPEYADRLGEYVDLTDLVRHPLISYDTNDPSWTGWNEWLAAFSVQAPKRSSGMRCSFYAETIHAALNGQGIALGWRRLVQDLLDQNRLVRITSHAMATRNGYFIVVPARRERTEPVKKFAEWLKLEAALSALGGRP
ncbi:LysR family transcriptional regulator [Tianweitania sp. Rool2]|uniref:LysR family transcriptional regulator n=2 Tax=Oryzicola mucosus TaxID=2767425 RepID=A0A8J6U4X1_9HYPH|nr:LysR family transcriptional regulator [Oryzicola mucosus]